MWLKSLIEHRHDLSVRLALWYAGILVVTLAGTLVILYLSMDAYLRNHLDTTMLNGLDEFNTLYREGGLAAIEKEMALESESEGIGRVFFRLLAEEGRTRLHSDMVAWEGLPPAMPSMRSAAEDDYHFETLTVPGQDFEARVLTGRIGPDYYLQIVHSLREDTLFMRNIANLLLWFAAVLAVVGVVSGWYVSRLAVGGIRDITRAAEQIAEGRFETRAATRSRLGEIEKLANTFNLMLDRIQSLMNNLKEVNDNIAHDLRSPIGRIRSAAEMALTGSADPNEQSQALARTIGECDRLLGMVNTMLLISEIESGLRPAGNDPVELGGLVAEACELFEPVAEGQNISVALYKPEQAVTVPGNAAALQRMVANLLDNAIKYTPPGGRVWVHLNPGKKDVEIQFQDTGTGIRPADIPHIFERFFRCDASRRHPGSGLGLSLAQAVARSHDGSIEVHSVPGEGSLFAVRLPRG